MSMTIFNKMQDLTIEVQDRAEQINRLKLYIFFNALSTDFFVCGSIVADNQEFLDSLKWRTTLEGRREECPNWDKFQTLMADKHHEIPEWIQDL